MAEENFMAPSAQSVAVFGPLIIGLPTTLGTIVIHGIAVVAIIYFVRYQFRSGRAGVQFWRDLGIVASVTIFALMAHLLEIVVWAIVFGLCGEFNQVGTAVYHSAMNYTTLGYGDVVMCASWKVFGPLEAADGMLMFGVSTAMIFAVIQALIQIKFPDART
jgi:Ion channel